MATDLEYALMAGDAYVSNRSDINKFPVPIGWISKKHATEPSGFEAISFTNGSEIVISFAGTDQYDKRGDWKADIWLGKGWCSDQLLQAAAYYMEVRALYGNDVTITFTGHSLGGGLAALLGVFFDQKAVTFDQAPFLNSATEEMSEKILSYLRGLKNSNDNPLYTEAQLQTWAQGLYSFADLALEYRKSNISGYYVQGEALTTDWPFKNYSKIGTEKLLDHGTTQAGTWSLHSQALLTAFLLNRDFEDVTKSQTDLLGMIFDKKLYAQDTDPKSQKENFLERLVRHQSGTAADPVTGVAAVVADNMLTRFTNDLMDISQKDGLSMSNKYMTDALTAFAMQFYYASSVAVTPSVSGYDITYPELFDVNGVTGGIHFSRSDGSIGDGSI